MKEFKDKLVGERLILKRTKPTIEMAEMMFSIVDSNREYLQKWLPWVKFTLKIEDTLKYLFEKEKETEKGKKVEYGLYVNKNYIGNIGIFNINEEIKSAEIGYWLSAQFARKGYMTEAVKIAEKYFFTEGGLNRIQICCDKENKASLGVAEKCDYELEGTFREAKFNEYFNRLVDSLVFSKLKSEYNKQIYENNTGT